MKSSRNPLSKQVRSVRRMTRPTSDDATCTASDVDVNQKPEPAAVSAAHHHCDEEQRADSASEVTGAQSIVSPTPCESDKVTSLFQLEFLKMLSQNKCAVRGSGLLGHRWKQRKVSKKSQQMVGRHKVVSTAQQGSSTSTSISSILSQTTSHQAVNDCVKDEDEDERDVTGIGLCCATVTHDSETMSAVVRLNNSQLLSSSDMQQEFAVDFVTADDTAVKTCAASCDDIADDSSDVLPPPVLSLPDPLTDRGECPRRPPVLQPSFVISSTTHQTVSDAVTVTRDGQTHSVDMSEGRGNELQTPETSCVDVTSSQVHHTGSRVQCSVSDVMMSCDTASSSSVVAASAVNTQLMSCDSRPGLSSSSSSVVAAAAVNTQPSSAHRISSLAQFRPTISVNALLPSTSCCYNVSGTRPTVPLTPQQKPRHRPSLGRQKTVSHVLHQ